MATKTVSTTKKTAAKQASSAVVVPTVVPGKGRKIVGEVVSDRAAQTVVVEVNRLVAHPLYHKRMRKTNKFHAHNIMGARKGNVVEISETRPISKLKNFIVTKIIS